MRIASFNVENLFQRAKALALPTWADGRPILEAYDEVNRLLNEPVYADNVKARILELLEQLGVRKSDEGGEFARLRTVRGKLLLRKKTGEVLVVADGRPSWIGWVELKTETVNEQAMRHTAMVMRDVDADILAVVEAESRITLNTFSADLLTLVGGSPYAHVMVIDGNDDRGIDVGLMTTADHEILSIRSHVDDGPLGNRTFGRDCPVYRVAAPGGEIVLLVNHLKSKGFGKKSDNDRRRLAQAKRVAEIYRQLRDAGAERVIVLGDLNDTPDSGPLAPLVAQTDLKDISRHASFDDGGFPGTFGGGSASNKIDYILLSPALFAVATGGGVFRKGAWPGVRPKKWDVYDTLKKEVEAAPDHAAIYADLDV